MKKESNSSKKKKLINLHSTKSKQAFIMLIVMLVQIFMPIMKVEAQEYISDFHNLDYCILKKGDKIVKNSNKKLSVNEIFTNYPSDHNKGYVECNEYTITTDYALLKYAGYDTDNPEKLKVTALYKISFDMNGGQGAIDYRIIWNNSPYSYLFLYTKTLNSANYIGLPTPEREGYEFDGWYTEAVGGTKVTNNTTFNNASNTTLYAHWTAMASYTINENLTYNGAEQTGITYNSDTTNITGTYKATNVGD